MAETMATAPPRDQPVAGILSLVLALFVFSFQDSIIKFLSGDHSVLEIVFLRSVVGLPLIAAVLFAAGGGAAFRTRRPGLQLYRGLLVFLCFTFYYLGFAAMPMFDAAALYYSSPLFVTLLAVPLLGERIGLHRCLAVGLGFVGVVVMLRPGAGVFQPAALLPIASALTYAYAAIVTRRLGQTDSSGAITFYTTLSFAACSLAAGAVLDATIGNRSADPSIAFLIRDWVFPAPRDLMLIVLIGVIAAVGQFGIVHAYRVAPASTVAPFDYSYLIWIALLGYLIWGEVPAAHSMLGMALVVSGGLYVLFRENQRRRVSRMPVTAKASTLR